MTRHQEQPRPAPRPPERATDRPDAPVNATRWRKPTYQVVEASLEVSAYYLAKR
ncbi:pyrroloquinoline quinone precursor peptide PqqA [Kitasatospora sp. NPDC004799]|uniref:pyrroloquinoline quinone precursor peptide PqqA n=1 Tax=Kitasatospora sp. NPDC004799 TaxID=3154460 RepID=UPI0033B23241